MTATLTSVAAAAGVSTSTASRALSGHPSVLPSTRARVEAAAADLHYQPDRTASALRTRRTGLLGLVAPELRTAAAHAVADTLQRWAGEHDYQLLLCTTGGAAEREAAFLQTARAHHFDGVLVAASGANPDLVESLVRDGRAVVTLGGDPSASAAPSVVSDRELAARLATEHLLARGHTRIALVAPPSDVPAGRLQLAGHAAALAAAGLPPAPELVHTGPTGHDLGSRAAAALLALDPRPTALVVGSHAACPGVLQMLTARGIAVPRQLSLVCTEDDAVHEWWAPPLTAVDHRPSVLAERAGALLLAQLTGTAGDYPVPRTEVVAPVLVERASTAAPR